MKVRSYVVVIVLILFGLIASPVGAQTSTFVLKWGARGNGNGQFSFPRTAAVDGSGNVYVLDQSNSRIQKFDSSGTFLLKWGSNGSGNGQFNNPLGVAVDGGGNVYVADQNNHRIQKFDSSGNFLLKWGTFGTGNGQFRNPWDVAVDGSGNVYVADGSNFRIQKFDSSGNFLLKWGSNGSGNGQFNNFQFLAVDRVSGNVYSGEENGTRIQKFDASGNFLLKWGSFGSGNGQFNFPSDAAVDGSGNVYVADADNNRIQEFDANGNFLRTWGTFGTGDGQFKRAFGVAVDGSTNVDGSINVYVVDQQNHRMQKFRVTQVAEDTTPPALSLPADITAEATGPNGAAVSYTATATDIVDGSRPVICDHISGSTFPLGTTTVQCTAVDTHNNTAHGSFAVLVRDTTPPALSLPAGITAEATGPGGAAVSYSATAIDIVDGSRAVTCDHSSGSTFPLGTTTVQCTATDTRNNTAHGSFTVTVRDTTPPVLALPANITAEATGPSGAAVSYSATATDLVDGSDPVTCDHVSGSTFPLGSTIVQCTATDAHNNTAHGSFTVTVRDTTPPVLSLPADITAEATAPSGAPVNYTATASDIVDGSDPVNCDHVSGSTFPLGTTTVQCTATDTHNNTAHGSFTVTVRDTTPPAIVSITANPSSLWPPDHKAVAVTVTVIASDLVDPNPTSHIISVSSNQPVNGIGDGNTTTDWTVTGPLTLNLLAERTGGSDRVYTITVETTDFSGNAANGTVTVTVGQSRGRGVH